jgi:apolipoprotein N-acyltransferase
MNNTKCKVIGIVGALLVFFYAWQYNLTIAPWLSLPMLMYSFRRSKKLRETFPATVVVIIARFFSLHGGWDMSLWLELAFALVVSLPIIISLYLDRYFNSKMKTVFRFLLFSCLVTILDWLVTFMNLGMTFSLAYTQAQFLEFLQIASLFGSFMVGFICAMFAPFVMLIVDNLSDLKAIRLPALTIAAVFLATVLFGSLRMSLARAESNTVKIASLAVTHEEDYWTTITDANTPPSDAQHKKANMAQIVDECFMLSKKAADFGSKIIFWSEGASPVYEDDYPDFLDRAKKFAKDNNVYFIPTAAVFMYNTNYNANIALVISPQGELLYRYEKSISWYPSKSDGIVPVIDTPFGKISTAICFDMDYPALINQAHNADIMLVPAYDTRKIDDFHTRVAFLRGIENGFSVIRHSNSGSSISADYYGNTLTYQNYFRTDERLMISDVPAKGVKTLYGTTGELFLWLVFAAVPFMLFTEAYMRKHSKNKAGKAVL